MPASALAVDAVWNANPSSSFWNDGFNWTPTSAPVHAGDMATFNTSNVTSLQLSGDVTIDSMTFNTGASAFRIDTSGNSFSLVGHGINNSGTTQTIINEAGGTTNFLNSTTAANASITSVDGGSTNFFNSSTAANAGLLAAGGADCCPEYGSGSITFSDHATAGNAGVTAGGGAGAGGGSISFSDNSRAGNATLFAAGGSFGAGGPGGGAGNISFSGDSTADNATLSANSGDEGDCGSISFSDNSSARQCHAYRQWRRGRIARPLWHCHLVLRPLERRHCHDHQQELRLQL